MSMSRNADISRRARLASKAIALAIGLTLAALAFLLANVGYRDLAGLTTETPVAEVPQSKPGLQNAN